MNRRRRQGGLSLIGVIFTILLIVGLVLTAVVSVGTERNLFAVGWAKLRAAASGASGELFKKEPEPKARSGGAAGKGEGGGAIRRCVIDGKTVISNTDCKPGKRAR
jgi:hypothetical protein